MTSHSLGSSVQSLRKISAFVTVFKDPLMRCLTPHLSRSMATETQLPPASKNMALDLPPPLSRRPAPVIPDVLATVYRFPTMEPMRFTHYPANHLHLPLRRDLLHRAVIFEGDATRQGTASTKWRDDVRGSGAKIRAQKGTGRARLGDKKSPMLKGGGVAFGPHPRDFSTRLPRKIYDLAWRTALSYRYRRGELIIVENGIDVESDEPDWITKIMQRNHWGNADGRSMIVTRGRRHNLFEALDGAGREGRAKTAEDVDVKDILELGRIVIEKRALDSILRSHSSDLNRTVPSAVY